MHCKFKYFENRKLRSFILNFSSLEASTLIADHDAGLNISKIPVSSSQLN